MSSPELSYHHHQVKLSPDELPEVRRHAQAAGLSVRGWITVIVLREAGLRPKEHDKRLTIWRGVRR